MNSIKCSVSECHYNKNYMCDAPMIQVNHSGASNSQTSEETQCDTFKPKVQVISLFCQGFITKIKGLGMMHQLLQLNKGTRRLIKIKNAYLLFCIQFPGTRL